MEVKISEDQKQALEAALGADLAGQVISKSPDSFQKATKDLEGVISYKADMMDEEDDTEEDGKKPPYKKSADDTPAEMGSAIRDIANAVVKALEPQNEAQTKSIEMLSEAVKALHERLVQVEGKPKQKEMPHNPDITAILKDQKSGNEGDIQAANPTMGVVQKLYRPKQ